MSIQHLNTVRTIARAAADLGVTLPGEIPAALDHLDQITGARPEVLRPGTLARDLARHLGNPAAMEKARKAAALELAAAEAHAKIDTYLAETCGSRLRAMIGEQADTIAAEFGDALADDLTTLTETAGQLPASFRPEHAADLDPQRFAAWSAARDAEQRIAIAQAALAPLYSSAVADRTHFPTVALASLIYAAPPRFTDSRTAYAFRGALAGRAERRQGLAGQGSTFVDGLFIPTALAVTGATFEWATPTEVTDRAASVVAGMAKREPVSA